MKKRVSYLLFIIATVIWGFAFVAQKTASVIPVFAVGALRSLMATLVLIGAIPLYDRVSKSGRKLIKNGRPDFTKNEIVGGVLLGVIITVATSFQQYGIEHTEASKAAFITALYVVIVPILAAIFGKKPSVTSVISIPIAVVGFYLMCISGSVNFEIADLMVLICAVIFAFHIITVDHFSKKCDGVRMSCIQFATALVLNTIASFIFGEQYTVGDVASALPSLLFLGVLSSGIAYTLQIIGQREADPTVSSLILSLESVVGVIGAALILGERMSAREYIGCGVVLFAVFLSQIEPKSIVKAIKRSKDE